MICGSGGSKSRLAKAAGAEPAGFGAEPGQVQHGSGEVPEKVPGGFGAEPGHVQQGSEEGSGEGLGGLVQASEVMFNRVPKKVPAQVPETLVQSQVKLNRFPKKVPAKVWSGSTGTGRLRRRFGRLWCRARSRSTGFLRRFRRRPGRLWCRARSVQHGSGEGSGEGLGGFGAEPGHVQQVTEKVAEGSRKLWCKAKSGSTGWEGPGEGFGNLWCRAGSGSAVQQGFQRLASQHAWERFLKIKRCGCWGYHLSLFSVRFKRVAFTQVCVAKDRVGGTPAP